MSSSKRLCLRVCRATECSQTCSVQRDASSMCVGGEVRWIAQQQQRGAACTADSRCSLHDASCMLSPTLTQMTRMMRVEGRESTAATDSFALTSLSSHAATAGEYIGSREANALLTLTQPCLSDAALIRLRLIVLPSAAPLDLQAVAALCVPLPVRHLSSDSSPATASSSPLLLQQQQLLLDH